MGGAPWLGSRAGTQPITVAGRFGLWPRVWFYRHKTKLGVNCSVGHASRDEGTVRCADAGCGRKCITFSLFASASSPFTSWCRQTLCFRLFFIVTVAGRGYGQTAAQKWQLLPLGLQPSYSVVHPHFIRRGILHLHENQRLPLTYAGT